MCGNRAAFPRKDSGGGQERRMWQGVDSSQGVGHSPSGKSWLPCQRLKEITLFSLEPGKVPGAGSEPPLCGCSGVTELLTSPPRASSPCPRPPAWAPAVLEPVPGGESPAGSQPQRLHLQSGDKHGHHLEGVKEAMLESAGKNSEPRVAETRTAQRGQMAAWGHTANQ